MLNEAGNFTVLHPKTHLRYFDRARHLTPIGLKLIEPMFVKMSAELPSLLAAQHPDNVIEWTN
ncbi:hypothetical protein PFISCL1PPCAC_22219 [Pristionchus fissidentatus]|uniref:SGNH domain-containing protein n=1 Tax=Pristionchus fissidentatus TaxID=1538716 RepID=A0AAV5WGB3_9BILA|nr:hypothetical protein PFISCL1PPCAC_22219 [Pristionchus fissidentatus]